MLICNDKPHLGDALMILAMMKKNDVYAGTPACNALLMNNVRIVPVEHIVHYDVDVSDVVYASWEDYAEALGVGWDGQFTEIFVIAKEIKACKLPDTGRIKIGLCTTSRDKHRCYPHHKALVEQLKKYGDVYVFGREREQLPIRQLVSEVSQMDKMVSVDCGVAHLAGCLDVPLVIIEGPTDCRKLYDCYADTKYVSTDKDNCDRKPCVNQPCKYANCMYLIEPEEIVDAVKYRENTQVMPPANTLPATSPLDNQEKIVIVRMKGIGDILMTWFGLEALRRDNPDAHITYVTSPACTQLFYGQDDLVDKVIPSDWDYEPHGIPKLPPSIRKTPHDRIIELDNRIDFHDTIEATLGDRSLLHTSPRADNFAMCMGVNLDGNIFHRMLEIPDKLDKWACKILVENDIADQEDSYELVSCQLDAKGATRNWHIDRWIQLAKLLIKEGYGVIWFSITPEHQYLKLDGVLNLACQTSVSQMIALMSKCRYAISTCSASVHIAHRLSRTTPIGIYGSTDYKLLGVYYDDLIPITNYDMDCAPCVDWGHECLGQPGAPWCINQISPRQVLKAIT